VLQKCFPKEAKPHLPNKKQQKEKTESKILIQEEINNWYIISHQSICSRASAQ